MSGNWLPPGYKHLTALTGQHGVNSVRSDLFSGRRQAFMWDGTAGELEPIEPKVWLADVTEEWLVQEPAPGCMIVVRVEEEPQSATDGVYVSPFMRLMAAAVRHFNIGAESCPEKKTLVEHFCAQTVDGKPVTKNLASQMATLCRPPSAMRGGNRKG